MAMCRDLCAVYGGTIRCEVDAIIRAVAAITGLLRYAVSVLWPAGYIESLYVHALISTTLIVSREQPVRKRSIELVDGGT